ncbi:MAG: hypothetical protein ACC657_01460 [Thiohalomonadales bacterium]
MIINKKPFVFAALASLSTANAIADTVVEQGIVVTFQTADDDVSKDEIAGSYDLVVDTPIGKGGHLITYVEGASGLADDGVANTFGEANGDAGSAYGYDSSGNQHGAFQVSELFYQHDFGESFITFGMMDATAYGDGGEIANDEGASFITTDLVNNPTIAFPNYTMAVAGHGQFNSIGINLFYGGAEGYDGNYTELVHFRSDTNGNDKGEFILVEGTWSNDSTTVRLGYWINNDYANGTFNGSTANNAENSGVYGLVEFTAGSFILNGRYGIADDTISEIDSFVSVAGELGVGPGAFGLGYAYSTVSINLKRNPDQGDGRLLSSDYADRTSIELFYRYEAGSWTLTPAISSIDNSALYSASTKSAVIYTLRGTYGF